MSSERAAKRAKMNPLMMNPMAAMMMNPSMAMGLNPMMMQAMGMNQDEDDHDEVPDNHSVETSSMVSPSAVAAPAAAPPAMVVSPAVVSPAGVPPGLPEENPDDFNALQDSAISRSVTYVKTLPRLRLSEALEYIHPSLDAAMTAQLTPHGLLALLWVMTKMTPTIKISDLRVVVRC